MFEPANRVQVKISKSNLKRPVTYSMRYYHETERKYQLLIFCWIASLKPCDFL